MPKIIENLKQRLLTEAKEQIAQHGYECVTIRSIAQGCGVGVGTVYNYFPSKETLIATFLLEDWQDCLTQIQSVAACSQTPQPVLQCMYDQLTGFACRYEAVFRSESARSVFSGSFSQNHRLLRTQLAQPLQSFCHDDFTALFVAESLLIWSMEGKSFPEIYNLLKKLF